MDQVCLRSLAPKGMVGGPFGSSLVSRDYVDDGVPVIRGANMGAGPWLSGDFVYVSREKFESDLARNSATAGDLVFTQRGTLGQVVMIPEEGHETYVVSQSQMRMRIDRSAADPRYVYYACTTTSFNKQVADRAISTGVPHINLGILGELTIPRHSLEDQRAIAEVLGALDDKIAANTREIGLADDLASALYEASLESDPEARLLADVAVFHNRRRVPLSAMERDARPGTVPYFGAAGRMDYVDEALFDEELLLVGEDGSVVQEDGRPVTQYIWGPSWVNNHAHVLTGHGISTELLRLAVRRSNVLSLVTGAVQPKISMRNLKSLPIELPTGAHCERLSVKVDALMAVVRRRTDENRSLATARDALLPLLMSGRVTVKDAEKVVEGVA